MRVEEFKDITVRDVLMGWNGLENALEVDLDARSVVDEQSFRQQGATYHHQQVDKFTRNPSLHGLYQAK